MKTKITTFIILLALLFIPSASAQAQSPNGDVFRLGENYTLKSGDTLNGKLAVIGGNALIEKDSEVKGDIVLIGGNLTITGTVNGRVALIGGNLTISGTINGDVAVIGGQAILKETAFVNGGMTTIGGQIEKEPGAKISGEVVNNAPLTDVPPIPAIPSIPDVPAIPNAPDAPNAPDVNVNINPLWQAVNIFGRALAIAAIGMLLTLFLQPQLERVGDTITRQPVLAGSFGLLALVVAPIAMLIMIVTLILIPVALIVAFVIPLAWLFGIIALGQEVGERFTQAINQTWAPVLATGFGTFMLLLIGGFVGLIPCFGWLILFFTGLVAVGGVAMTWFGSRPAPAGMIQKVEVPPAS